MVGLCLKVFTMQGKELLSPGKNAMYNEEHKIITPMIVSSFYSPAVHHHCSE